MSFRPVAEADGIIPGTVLPICRGQRTTRRQGLASRIGVEAEGSDLEAPPGSGAARDCRPRGGDLAFVRS